MRYLFVLILCSYCELTFAAEPAVVSISESYQNIGKQVSLLKDRDNSLTLAQVKVLAGAGKFKSVSQSIVNLGNSTSAFWIKINYRNPSNQAAYLVIDVPNVDYIDFYTTDQWHKPVHQRAGVMVMPSANVLAANHYVFDLPSTKGENVGEVYLKVRSNNILLLPLKVANSKTLITSANHKIAFEAAYSGILIMLFLFNVFLFLSFKDKTYLYYALYIAALFVYVVLYLRGFSYLLGSSFSRFINLYPHVFFSVGIIAIFLFSWEFLAVKQRARAVIVLHQLMIVLWAILLVGACIFGKGSLSMWANYAIILSCIVACYCGIVVYKSGLKPALYYVIAWFAVGISVLLAMLGITNVIPYTDLYYEIGPIGSVVEMLFLFFALGDRFNQMRKEKMQVEQENFNLIISHNEKLESVVEERTKTLLRTNAEKDKLFSIVAHDLRSPFHSLVSILELNDHGLLNFEELKLLLNESKKNVDQIRLTLDNLLFWAKGQMERTGTVPTQVDLALLIEKLILVYEPLLASKMLSLTMECEGSTLAFADVNQVNLILRNLIDNAIKFSRPNSKIRLTVNEQAHGIQVAVCNSIDPNNAGKLETLLAPTEFLNTTGTNNEQGIGLGLHLCREFVRLNKGEMNVVLKTAEVMISFTLPKLESD
jgi:signal transduction histidine kinase